VVSTDTPRDPDLEETSISKEAETMAAHPTLPNSMTNKKTTPEVTHRRVSNLRKRCMVDRTEAAAAMAAVATEVMAAAVDIETAAKEVRADTETVAVSVTEAVTVAMVAAADSKIRDLKCLLSQKAPTHRCCRIISSLKQTHS
jgi:hypothetical protein